MLAWNFVKNGFSYFTYRSSRRRCSVKKGVLKNFTKYTGKHLCQSLFFNKKNPVNFVKFLRTHFTEHLWTTASLHNISYSKHLLIVFILSKHNRKFIHRNQSIDLPCRFINWFLYKWTLFLCFTFFVFSLFIPNNCNI